jgi:hypothetical protein
MSAPPGGPAPLSGFWLGIAAVVLAVASAVAALCKEIAARWRGIVVAHLFFLTLWMAVQVFFFATGAYWCLPTNSSRVVVWLTKSFAQVARCGPALSAPAPAVSAAFQGATAVAAPALAPVAAPSAPVQALPRMPPFGASAGASPPSAGGTPATSGSASGWSPRTIANCWRNRAVDSGDCYETGNPRRRPPQPPPRYRYPVQRPLPYPCRRAYDCWPDGSWRHDL